MDRNDDDDDDETKQTGNKINALRQRQQHQRWRWQRYYYIWGIVIFVVLVVVVSLLVWGLNTNSSEKDNNEEWQQVADDSNGTDDPSKGNTNWEDWIIHQDSLRCGVIGDPLWDGLVDHDSVLSLSFVEQLRNGVDLDSMPFKDMPMMWEKYKVLDMGATNIEYDIVSAAMKRLLTREKYVLWNTDCRLYSSNCFSRFVAFE